MKFGSRLLVAAVFALGIAKGAVADVLFSNFPDPLYGGNYQVAPGSGSQEFTVGALSTIQSMSISSWVSNGGLPTTMHWLLSTGAHGTGTTLASGTSAVTNTFFTSNGYDIYTSTFSLPDVVLAAGNYFATLSTDPVPNGYSYWGVTQLITGMQSYTTYDGSNWFNTSGSYENLLQVNGIAGTTNVPEPASLALLGLGLTGLGFARRRKQKTA